MLEAQRPERGSTVLPYVLPLFCYPEELTNRRFDFIIRNINFRKW